jgi:hypothetical protein
MKSPEFYPCESFLSKRPEENHADRAIGLMAAEVVMTGTTLRRENKKDRISLNERCP